MPICKTIFKRILSGLIYVLLMSTVLILSVSADSGYGPAHLLKWKWADDIFPESPPNVKIGFSITFPNKKMFYPSGRYAFFMIDGQLVPETAVVIINDRALVSDAIMADYLGMAINWDGGDKISVKKEGLEIILNLDSEKAIVNTSNVVLDAPARLINGKLYIPLRFIAESLGMDVGYYHNDPFDIFPVVWIENEKFAPNSGFSEEEALKTASVLLHEHYEWANENHTERVGLKEVIGNLRCVSEFGRYWVLGDGYQESSGKGNLLVNKYTKDVHYYRGSYATFWIAILDHQGFIYNYYAG